MESRREKQPLLEALVDKPGAASEENPSQFTALLGKEHGHTRMHLKINKKRGSSEQSQKKKNDSDKPLYIYVKMGKTI